MASAALDLLLGKIPSLLETEANLLVGVRDEMKDIQAELQTMKAFLEDADRRQQNNEVEKDWVGNVRDITYEVEDIIDEFTYHMNEQRTGNPLSRFLCTVWDPKNLWVRDKIATQLQMIKKTIKEIPERNQRYRFDPTDSPISDAGSNNKKIPRELALYVKEDELVGIEKHRQLLMGLLMDGYSYQAVVTVLGMGGAGKTTIVSKIFNNDVVSHYFDCSALIFVSQNYALTDILRRLIKEFHNAHEEIVSADLEAMPQRELMEKLVTHLSQKRYLLVLDDVWDINLWKELRVVLPNSRGSRIVITTRKENIATYEFGVRSDVHHVQPLEPDEAWKLFCMKAFYSHPENLCPDEFKDSARVLVKKCKGLPLALVAMGALMYSKKNVAEWIKVCKSLNWYLDKDDELSYVKDILLLSYKDLPYKLKPCFLFCSVFPEDYAIRRKRLMRLWIAEGFIEAKGRSSEEVAEEYLMGLTFRGMLQVVESNYFGRPKTFKMHALMRDIAMITSHNERFCAFSEGDEEIDCGRARRLSVQFQTDKLVEIKSSSNLLKLRSLLAFYPQKFSQNPLLNTLPSNIKLLKVLDFEDLPIDNLPDEVVKKLFNLRYLSIRRTLIKKLPNSIGRLRYLHTLDLKHCNIEVLPDQVGKLQNLHHLIMHRKGSNTTSDNLRARIGVKVPVNINDLKKLQVLCYIEAEGYIIRRLGTMTQLTRIGISSVKKENGKDLCNSIQKMKSLHCLFVISCDSEEVLDIDYLDSPPPQLEKVGLCGKLERVPRWLCSLHSLSHLSLHFTRLNQDVLPHIADLPCLINLSLFNAYMGPKLYFQKGFTKLVKLNLEQFSELIEIEIERGVMPNISLIYLNDMTNLKSAPLGIELLLKLETLVLMSVSYELVNRIKEGGEDHQKVKHIPNLEAF